MYNNIIYMCIYIYIYIYIYSGVGINKTIYFTTSSFTYIYDHQVNKGDRKHT